ncbi:MAG: class I SAM-dependent methyltransferase [Acidimicrobiales bacterium]|jgi:SAM-dependent methyltransferase
MNEAHLRLCSSPEWAAFVESELLPWALARTDLGDDVLEIGPGPGLTTDLLRARVLRLTAVERDGALAALLARRLRGKNVAVICADGSQLPFDSGRFSAATLFTMLHHVGSAAVQDQLLAELCRVLRPGGIVVGTDSMETPGRRDLHLGDVYVPVDPAGLEARLRAAGLVFVVVEQDEDRFRFVAEAPRGNAERQGPDAARGQHVSLS